ncbi:MAG: hypothetical protein V3S49_01820 [Thermodesulfobacteriota bacterium]
MLKNVKPIILIVAIIISLLIISVVSFHSLEEIHYLKTFYPPSFTVEEAFYASAVELVKILVISLPFFVIIVVCLYSLKIYCKKD